MLIFDLKKGNKSMKKKEKEGNKFKNKLIYV